jgi:hypothetical protein
MIIIKNYWRVSQSALPPGFSPLDEEWLVAPVEMIRLLRPGHGVAYASWDDAKMVGHVTSLGVCLEKTDRGARMDWREVQITLMPLPQGRTQWRNRPFFRFDDTVIQRYGLADLFTKRFTDLDQLN